MSWVHLVFKCKCLLIGNSKSLRDPPYHKSCLVSINHPSTLCFNVYAHLHLAGFFTSGRSTSSQKTILSKYFSLSWESTSFQLRIVRTFYIVLRIEFQEDSLVVKLRRSKFGNRMLCTRSRSFAMSNLDIKIKNNNNWFLEWLGTCKIELGGRVFEFGVHNFAIDDLILHFDILSTQDIQIEVVSHRVCHNSLRHHVNQLI